MKVLSCKCVKDENPVLVHKLRSLLIDWNKTQTGNHNKAKELLVRYSLFGGIHSTLLLFVGCQNTVYPLLKLFFFHSQKPNPTRTQLLICVCIFEDFPLTDSYVSKLQKPYFLSGEKKNGRKHTKKTLLSLAINLSDNVI